MATAALGPRAFLDAREPAFVAFMHDMEIADPSTLQEARMLVMQHADATCVSDNRTEPVPAECATELTSAFGMITASASQLHALHNTVNAHDFAAVASQLCLRPFFRSEVDR